ncbi:DEDD exonuclease domain-containing protein [Rhodocaloribacter sp.]
MRIEETPFIVTDTETTGVSAARDRVIELAAVKVVGGEVVDRFSRLINPGQSVPRRITALTGISTAMVFDQPSAAEVLPRYLDFLGEGVFVAHNLNFDLGFLNAELARLGRPAIGNPGLCTLRLARRLLRGLRSKSLGSVAEFYGIRNHGRHRALGDAETTAEVLRRFLSHITFETGLETLEELLAFQNRTYVAARKEPKHLRRIRTEVLPRLPDGPGVYFMKDRQGKTIYIGKAKRLRSRVRSYFTGIESHTEHVRQMIGVVRDVAWEETGSELAALLLESRLIKAEKPRFNRAQRRYRNRPFIRLDTADRFPRVGWQSYLTDDGAEYFGPVGGRRQAERIVEVIDRFFRLRECDDDTFARGHRCLYAAMGRCDAPCEGGAAAERYADEVRRVRDFLTGRDRTALDRLREEMAAAAAALDFEEAAARRDAVETLTHLLDKQQCVAAPVLDHNAALVMPGAEAGTVQLFVIRFGRPAETLTLRPPLDAAAEAALRTSLRAHFDSDRPRPERYLREEVDEVRLLAHWLYVNRENARQIPWREDLPFEDFFSEVIRKVQG